MIKQPSKVIAMHDMCGYGRVSLTAVMTVLAGLNCRVSPLPTALLSSHFGFGVMPTVLNLGEELKKFIPSWKEAGFTFDAFYSGYLADPSQVEIGLDYIKNFKPRIVYVDPVLGDNLKLYSAFDDKQVQAMITFLNHADIISPNLTEAFFLLGMEPKESVNRNEAKDMLQKLAQLGPKYPVITGVPSADKKKIHVFAFDKEKNTFYELSTQRVDKDYTGTGDSFASALLGNIMNDVPFPHALNRAMSYLIKAVEYAMEFDTELCLEAALPDLMLNKEIAEIEVI